MWALNEGPSIQINHQCVCELAVSILICPTSNTIKLQELFNYDVQTAPSQALWKTFKRDPRFRGGRPGGRSALHTNGGLQDLVGKGDRKMRFLLAIAGSPVGRRSNTPIAQLLQHRWPGNGNMLHK